MREAQLKRECAELVEKVRLLSIENDHLAERAEETMLLGLLAEKVNASHDVDDLIAVAVEQVAVLKAIPYVGCYAVAEGQAWVVHDYTLEDSVAGAGDPFAVAADLMESVMAGGCQLWGAEQSRFSLKGRVGGDLQLGLTVLLPLRNQHGPALLMVFASDETDALQAQGELLLPRLVDMIGARVENLALLSELTRANERLDNRVQARTAELQASERRLRALFEGTVDTVLVVDRDLNIRDVNQQACRNLGYTRAELLQMKAPQLWADPGDPAAWHVAASLNPGALQSAELNHRRKDGSVFPVEVRASGVEIDDQPMILAQARDVSERNRLLAQLHQAQKMEAVGRLAGGIAHDFNNILTAILGQVDLLKLDLARDQSALEDLDLVQVSAERAADLTRQLLAFSRKQVLNMRPQDLSRCVTDASRMLLRVIDESVNLKLDLAEDGACVFGDQTQIDQILMNLVINARDAMPEGGDIVIVTRQIDPEDEFLPAHPDAPEATGRYILLSVSDTGQGVAPEIQEKVFEPFFTTKEVGRGTGLGLALVYGLGQQHHAHVRLRSEPGRGATFEIIFPGITPEALSEENHQGPEMPRGDETILLVEDDQTIQGVVARMIESLGYNLLQAGDGVEGLAVAGDFAGEINLVLTDVIMPRMSGPAMVREMRDMNSGLRVVYMSGYTDDKVGREELAQAGTHFVQKPISFTELAALVRETLDEQLPS